MLILQICQVSWCIASHFFIQMHAHIIHAFNTLQSLTVMAKNVHCILVVTDVREIIDMAVRKNPHVLNYADNVASHSVNDCLI